MVIDKSLLQIVSKLKDEITLMEREHNDLQLHIARTDWWCENLGMWKAFIISGEVWFLWVFIFCSSSNLQKEKDKKKLHMCSFYLCLSVCYVFAWGEKDNFF